MPYPPFRSRRVRSLVVVSIRLASLALLVASFPASLAAADLDFAHDIAPILRQHCAKCHAGDKLQGGFSLNTREELLAGGESGKVVVPGKSGASALIERITTTDADLRMPPEGPRLPPGQVGKLKAWIDTGMKWEPGLTLAKSAYEPPLKPRRPTLPPGEGNPLDRLVNVHLAAKKLPPLEPIGDAEFLRRASLDLVGLLPEPDVTQKFLADPASEKRAALVGSLLADDVAYAEHWLTFWNDLLRNDYSGTGFITGGRKQITTWLYRSLVDNKPYDQMVRELISPSAESEGFIQGIRWRGDVSASQSNEIQFSQSVSQSLLGINMKCASCHDSFVDRWKLNDAYGLAAIFSNRPLPNHRCDKPTGETAKARWIFPELGDVRADAPQPERLKQLAALLVHPDNGRLSRTIVNRLWQRLLGRGIVHPVDAMDSEPWSADVLDFLAADLQDHGYDLKHTLALIATSRTYQARIHSTDEATAKRANEFRGPVARRLSAEQFVDAVWQLTGAAPVRTDAGVVRGRTNAPKSGVKDADPTAAESAKLTARWIWSSPDAAAGAPASQTVVFRHRFELSQAPRTAIASLTCDNEYALFVNGQPAASDTNWETVESVALEGKLKQGANELVVVAFNGGAGPNPAGFVCELRVRYADGKSTTIASNDAWQWTSTKPDGRGRFKKEPDDWKPAAVLANPAVWEGRVAADLLAGLSNVTSIRMVRASLMKNDFLMRSLGRPHREQIVTARPEELTTLEAIDLANSEILANYLARGGQRWVTQAATDPRQAVESIYWYALCRAPTADEATLALELLGPQPTPDRAADLLWCILMLPEFQFIR